MMSADLILKFIYLEIEKRVPPSKYHPKLWTVFFWEPTFSALIFLASN